MNKIRLKSNEEVQEAFDKVVNHLLSMNKRSRGVVITGEDFCLYKDFNGNKCAIGCLIPDEVYRPEFEGQNVYDLQQVYQIFSFGSNKATILTLLLELQRVHDDTYNWKPTGLNNAAIKTLKDLARVFKLKYNGVK